MLVLSDKMYVIIILITIITGGLLYFNLQKKNVNLKTITPQCLVGALKNKNVLVVNVLSEKIPVHVGLDSDTTSISKDTFENILKENNGIPENIDMVILFCAAWSCSAGENYFNELVSRNIDSSKIIDYAGGIHEWCCYSKINPDFFKVYSENNGELNQILGDELTELVKNTGHSYKTNLLVNENNKLITDLCKSGLDITNNM
jgi:hypothetical protein